MKNQAQKWEKRCSREKSIKNRFLAPLLGPSIDFWLIVGTLRGPKKSSQRDDHRWAGTLLAATLGASAHLSRFWLHFWSILAPFWVTLAPIWSHFGSFFVFVFGGGNLFFGLLVCWVVVLLGSWVLGFLSCWVALFLGCWVVGWFGCLLVVGLLGCWVVGLLSWIVGLLVCWIVAVLVCWSVGLLLSWSAGRIFFRLGLHLGFILDPLSDYCGLISDILKGYFFEGGVGWAGLLGCWDIGFLGCWVIELLGCWFVNEVGKNRAN